MSEELQGPFLKFLESGVARGGFETDDALAALLPLMKQTLAAHKAGFVAPLDGIQELVLTEQGFLAFPPGKERSAQKNSGQVEAIQTPATHGVEVVGESRRTTDL